MTLNPRKSILRGYHIKVTILIIFRGFYIKFPSLIFNRFYAKCLLFNVKTNTMAHM